MAPKMFYEILLKPKPLFFRIGVLVSFLMVCNGQSNLFGSEIQYQENITKAKKYLVDQGDQLNFQAFMLGTYLKKKFPEVPAFQKRVDHDQILENAPQIKNFRRIIDGKVGFTIEDLNSVGSSIDKLTLRAIHCDLYPPHNKYLFEVEEVSRKGGYYLTHALWALEFLKDNQCDTQWGDKFDEVEEQIVSEVVHFIESADFYRDEVIEAIAFLYSSGNGHAVKTEWVNQVAFNQAEDGGWHRVAMNQDTNSKTTMLALWVLLEASYPNSERVSWIIK